MPTTEVRAKEGTVARGVSHPPLRGTQSFVSVMAQVWKQPSLTGIEILWRWGAGVPLLLLLWSAGSRALHGVPFDLNALENMTVFKPVEAVATTARQAQQTLPPFLPVLRWWLPLALLVWTAAAALGRSVIWCRLDPLLRPRYPLLVMLGALRTVLLLAVYGVWVWGLLRSGSYAVTAPAAAGAEPNLVLFMALAVALSLLLFMLWSLSSWILDAAPLFAMASGDGGEKEKSVLSALGAAWRARALRSKLMEINLVMGIVKVALLVLAMVFSACPLPFATVETNTFLAGWWSFVGLLYLVFSDLFQVIRRAAYLRLFQALVTPGSDTTARARSAS